MQSRVSGRNSGNLLRGAAVLLVAGTAAGCSSQVARFGNIDNIFTASTNQRQIVPQSAQPFPADQVAAAPIQAAPAGGVTRGSLAPAANSAPITATALAPAAPQPLPAAEPVVDRTTTGTVQAKPALPNASSDPAGWSRAGGTQVTIKQGETVYNLSRRYGVPANVIMQVNGLSDAEGLRAGQTVVIPTYVYSKKAPVSAPDNNPKVAAAKSSRGMKEQPGDGTKKLGETVAVLPNTPKAKDGKAPAQTSAEGKQAKAGSYVVQEGDTLTRIAKKTGASPDAIKKANNMPDGLVRIGQTLKIPAGAATVAKAAPAKTDPVVTATVKPEKPKAETVSYAPPKKTMAEAEDDNTPAPNATGIGKMRWPVRGRVISAYGKGGGKSNDGIDIAVPEGTAVKAAENGVVIYAGDGLKEFGNTVLVRHENGLVTVYGHASELKVTRGEKVKRGQEIAVSGMTGATSAPKLHFEVRKNSAPVDPSTFLE